MDLLQEIPLSAAFGISDGRGVGGLGNEEIGTAFINPSSARGKKKYSNGESPSANSLVACGILGGDSKEGLPYRKVNVG